MLTIQSTRITDTPLRWRLPGCFPSRSRLRGVMLPAPPPPHQPDFIPSHRHLLLRDVLSDDLRRSDAEDVARLARHSTLHEEHVVADAHNLRREKKEGLEYSHTAPYHSLRFAMASRPARWSRCEAHCKSTGSTKEDADRRRRRVTAGRQRCAHLELPHSHGVIPHLPRHLLQPVDAAGCVPSDGA